MKKLLTTFGAIFVLSLCISDAFANRQSSLGTFYFSDQPFASGGGTAGSKASFSSSEFIYARLVLKSGTVRTMLNPAPPKKVEKGSPVDSIDGYSVPLSVFYLANGEPTKLSYLPNYVVVNEGDLDKTYLDFDLLPAPDKASTVIYDGENKPARMMYDFLAKADEGNYKMGVQISVRGTDFRGDPTPAASWAKIGGEFSFTFRGSDYKAISANGERLASEFAGRAERAKKANEPLPKEWAMRSNPVAGGFTESGLKSMYVNSFSSGGGSNLSVVKFYAAPAAAGSWLITKNDLGIPKYRKFSQTYIVYFRNLESGNCFYEPFGLYQEYAGGGTYGATLVDHGWGARSITCDKLGLK
jgi:hypothetical protein